MGIVARALERRSTLAQPQQWLIDALGGRKSATGVRVNEETAMRTSAVFSCVKILAETVASLPLPVYRRLDGGGKERDPRHPLYPILHDLPNPEITSFEMRELLEGHLGLRGNAYSEIVRTREEGRVAELWPLPPQHVTVRRENGNLVYSVAMPDGGTKDFPKSKIWHIRGFSRDGVLGLSPIGQAREAIGLAVATEEFGARFFGSGTNIGGIARHPGKLSPEGNKNLRESINEAYGGLGKSHRVMLLEEGMEFDKIGISPDDSQFIETRKFQIADIARFYRMPLHLLGENDKAATYASVEQFALQFVVHTIRPWLVRWEQSIYRDLLDPRDRRTHFAEFLVDGLLRGDIKTRYESYAVARQNGWLNADDIRELENQNPLPDGQGKVYLVPLNMVPAQSVIDGNVDGGDEPASTARATRAAAEQRRLRSATSRRRISNAHKRVISEAAKRVIRRERSDVMRAAEKIIGRRDTSSFQAWLDDFYNGEIREFISSAFLPVYMTLGEQVRAEAAEEVGVATDMTPETEDFVRAYTSTSVVRHAGASTGLIRRTIDKAETDGEDVVTALDTMFGEWETERAGRISDIETVRAANAIAKATYVEGGVTKLRWVAFGENCPYCNNLNGKVVGINRNFLEAGENFKPEGADEPLRLRRSIGHAPAHPGCLPGDARVSAQGISGASKRWFDGDLVVIRTARGYELSSTPNHPILTPSGWVASGLLDVGGHVICHGSSEGESSAINGDHQDVPTRIEDIAESFGRALDVIAVPVPTASKHFHGDGAGSEVAVIWTNRQLGNRDDSALFQQMAQPTLGVRNKQPSDLPGLGGEALLIEGLPASGSCPVCGGGLSPAFAGSHLGGADETGLTATANSDSLFQESPAHNGTGDTEDLGQGVFGLPSDVFTDEIINIERYPFSGYVYNLQTEKSWYVAESIITHNCDCTISAVV